MVRVDILENRQCINIPVHFSKSVHLNPAYDTIFCAYYWQGWMPFLYTPYMLCSYFERITDGGKSLFNKTLDLVPALKSSFTSSRKRNMSLFKSIIIFLEVAVEIWL